MSWRWGAARRCRSSGPRRRTCRSVPARPRPDAPTDPRRPAAGPPPRCGPRWRAPAPLTSFTNSGVPSRAGSISSGTKGFGSLSPPPRGPPSGAGGASRIPRTTATCAKGYPVKPLIITHPARRPPGLQHHRPLCMARKRGEQAGPLASRLEHVLAAALHEMELPVAPGGRFAHAQNRFGCLRYQNIKKTNPNRHTCFTASFSPPPPPPAGPDSTLP